jgi:hypothetical protein
LATPGARFVTPDRACHAVQEGTAYAAVFMNVLRNVSKDDTTQYVLALLDEAVTGA